MKKKNDNVTQLVEKLNKLGTIYSKQSMAINDQIQKELNKRFKKMKTLNRACESLDLSDNFDSDECNNIYRWVRCDVLSTLSDIEKEHIGSYISDYFGASVNLEHNTLLIHEGECIVINEDNDIFCGGKLIIGSGSFESEKERNQLIEKYMEEKGFFPTVLYQSRYGFLSPVNTKE